MKENTSGLHRNHWGIKNKVTLILWCNENKDTIQERLNRGVPVAQIAGERGAPLATFRQVLKGIGINPHRGGDRGHKSPAYKDILTVLERVCKELSIPHEEIKPYLD